VLGIDSVFGLPVHPLVVHVAVVLVPLAAFALIALGWKGEWRQRYALPIAVLALAGGAAAILAASSGETLVSSVRQAAGTRVGFGEHPEQGDAARLFAVPLRGRCHRALDPRDVARAAQAPALDFDRCVPGLVRARCGRNRHHDRRGPFGRHAGLEGCRQLRELEPLAATVAMARGPVRRASEARRRLGRRGGG